MNFSTRSIFIAIITFFLISGVYSQNINCVEKINLGTNATTEQACFKLSEIVKNPSSYPVDLSLESPTQTLLSKIYIDGNLFTDSNSKGLSLSSEVCIDACGLNELRIRVSNSTSACWTSLSFKQSGIPSLTSNLTTDNYYTIETIPVTKPTVSASCGEATEGLNYFDWVQSFPCESGVQDTQSVIYREWEVFSKKSGIRTSIIDTIYVFYLPKLIKENFFGDRKVESFCIVNNSLDYFNPIVSFGLKYPLNPYSNQCKGQQIRSLNFDAQNDFVLTYKDSVISNSCPRIVIRKAFVKQLCWSSEESRCETTIFANEIVSDYDEENGYFELEQWIQFTDTIPSIFTTTPEDFEIGFTSDHGCETDVYAPSIGLLDNCSGTKSVTAYIPGYHSQKLTTLIDRPKGTEVWHKSDSTRAWSLAPGTYPILYVATDSCGNVGQYEDTTWVTVIDNLPPLAIADKNVSISLDNKEIWVDIDEFDEGSTDNCGLRFVLGRRTDWATSCGVNFCDKKSNSVEDYYDDVMFWLEDDAEPCMDFILDGWKNGISFYKEKNCGKVDEHGNPISSNIDKGIDGGWAKKIPFCCEDACKEVIVELLVVDHNCNYSKAWITVKVEENKEPAKVSDFSDLPISCNAISQYNNVIEAAKSAGNSVENAAAFRKLDKIFGSVVVGWEGTSSVSPIVDEKGNPIDTEWKYESSECYFEYKNKKVAVEGHDGEIEWIIERDTIVKNRNIDLTTQLGAVINLCGDINTEQDIWDQRNECGIGTITRRWKITSGCSELDSEGIILEQKIIVTQDCEFNKHMFDLSGDNYVCRYLNYDLDGNVNLDGALDLVFTGDISCRQVGIGYKDKVFEIAGMENVYKIERTWEVADWCTGQSEEFMQKIILDENCVNDNRFGFADENVTMNENKLNLGLAKDKEDTFAALELINSPTQVSVYPNPFYDRVTISINRSSDDPITLSVCDITGKEKLRKEVNSDSEVLSIPLTSEDLGTGGVYYYSIMEKGIRTANGVLILMK